MAVATENWLNVKAMWDRVVFGLIAFFLFQFYTETRQQNKELQTISNQNVQIVAAQKLQEERFSDLKQKVSVMETTLRQDFRSIHIQPED